MVHLTGTARSGLQVGGLRRERLQKLEDSFFSDFEDAGVFTVSKHKAQRCLVWLCGGVGGFTGTLLQVDADTDGLHSTVPYFTGLSPVSALQLTP